MTDDTTINHDVRVGENDFEDRFNKLDMIFPDVLSTEKPQLQHGVELQPLRPAAAAGAIKMRPLSDEPGDVKFDKKDKRKIISDLDERYDPLRSDVDGKKGRKTASEVKSVPRRPSLNRFLSQKND